MIRHAIRLKRQWQAALILNNLKALTALAMTEDQQPPKHRAAHQQALQAWRKRIGWVQ